MSDTLKTIEDASTIIINDFSNESFSKFMTKFLTLECDNNIEIIPIFINTYGGEVLNLFPMRDIIKSSKKPVATIVVGKAMSAGAVLLASGTKGYRYAFPNSEVMIHEVSGSGSGKTNDMKEDLKLMERLNKKLLGFLAEDMGRPISYVKQEISKRNNADWFLTAEQCKKLGLIDVIGVPRILSTNSKLTLRRE